MSTSRVPYRNAWILTGCFLLAAGLRIGAVFYPRVIDGDEVRYLAVAHHLRVGTGYQFWLGPETHVHPLHPLLLALFPGNMDSFFLYGKVIAAMASLLLILPLAALARSVGGARSGFILLLLAIGNSWMVRSAGWAQPESLYVLCVACALVLLLPATEVESSWGCWLAAGFCFGLAYLARPEGMLVGLLSLALAGLVARPLRWRRLRRPAAAAGVLLLVSLPFLVYLRRTTGAWMLTGKSEEMFFRAQLDYVLGGKPPERADYLAARERWEGLLPYTLSHPGWVLDRVRRNLLDEIWLLVRSLGAVGILGLLAWVRYVNKEAWRGRLYLLWASPILTFFLLLVGFPNERLVGSFFPFLLVPAALGWSALWDRIGPSTARRRSLMVLCFVLLLAVGWVGPVARRLAAGSPLDPLLEQRLAGEALRAAGSTDRIATNTLILSFYAHDPRLFGAPGSYRPLPGHQACPDLSRALRERGATVALMELGQFQPAVEITPGCPLSVVIPQRVTGSPRGFAMYRLNEGEPAR